ncbi:hypothetical protein [Methylobacterium oryzisoli]|uniref:hypothetical protein n=1 Tax=Methylobacterium oryzisoli TaxID=3385502 RepID=UPI0038929BB1
MSADPARAAWEAYWLGFMLGPGGVAPAWDDLPPDGRAAWERAAEAAIAAAVPQDLRRAAEACEHAPGGSWQEADAWFRFQARAAAFAWRLLGRGSDAH